MKSNTHPIDIPLLLGIAALAWWPLLIERPLVADDFYNGGLVANGLSAYWHKFGIWRIIGHPLPFILRDAIPCADRVLAFTIHIVSVLLFNMILRHLLVQRPINLAASIILAVMPFGFQALVWNSALTFALSTAFCLGLFLLLLRPIDNISSALTAGIVGGTLGFLSISANEATMLIIAWLALYPVMRSLFGDIQAGTRRTSVWPALWTGLLVMAFQVTWVILHFATKGVGFHKNPLFHAPAIVSGLFRQYIQATYVVHLQKLGDWLPAASYLSALAACRT